MYQYKFFFLHLGKNENYSRLLIKSLKKNYHDAEITQISGFDEKKIDLVDNFLQVEGDTKKICKFKINSFSKVNIDPNFINIFLDYDMIAYKKFDNAFILKSKKTIFCERSFNKNSILQGTIQNNSLIDIGYLKGKKIMETMPFIANFISTKDPNLFKDLDLIYDNLDENLHYWYGDQIVLKKYYELHPNNVDIVSENEYGNINVHLKNENVYFYHFKGTKKVTNGAQAKDLRLSKKGQELLKHYEYMFKNGYYRSDGKFIKDAYQLFGLKKFIKFILPQFNNFNIKSVLDYGSGGSDWENKVFEAGMSAKNYFKLDKVIKYEPARGFNDLGICDCVVCFDVLEHVYINDLNKVLRNIYSHAKKLVIIQVACYEAFALLPTGENAHVTQRPPMWWKGFIDNISIDFPEINSMLFCSTEYNKSKLFKTWNNAQYDEKESYIVKLE